jgi:hypothetical protein
MLRPPLFRLHVRIVAKLNPTLGLVRPLIRIVAIRVALALRPSLGRANRVSTPDRRRAPYPPPHVLAHLAQRHLHRCSHLSISILLFRTVRKMEDVLVQPGRSLCGCGTVVANRFISAQERGDLGSGGKAREEISKDGSVFDLARGTGQWDEGIFPHSETRRTQDVMQGEWRMG